MYVVCRRGNVLCTLFVGGVMSYVRCLLMYSGVHHILCCVFLRIVPYVASFSGLSIFDCPFGILYRLFKMTPLLSKFVSLGEPGCRKCFCCNVWDANFVVRDINICQLVN